MNVLNKHSRQFTLDGNAGKMECLLDAPDDDAVPIGIALVAHPHPLYGGTMEKKEWFENFRLFHEAGPGRCWPGGHASGGFTMVALYFVARRHQWRHARAILYASMVLGAIYGTTRVLQGWHFMSHTFWAGVIVWMGALVTALAFYGWRQLAPSPKAIPGAFAAVAR